MISISLTGKAALVSGGSRGIGRATALLMAQAGAKVAISYQRHEEAAREVVSAIQQAGGSSVAIRAELSRWEEANRLVASCVDQLGGLDVRGVNHGISEHAPMGRW